MSTRSKRQLKSPVREKRDLGSSGLRFLPTIRIGQEVLRQAVRLDDPALSRRIRLLGHHIPPWRGECGRWHDRTQTS